MLVMVVELPPTEVPLLNAPPMDNMTLLLKAFAEDAAEHLAQDNAELLRISEEFAKRKSAVFFCVFTEPPASVKREEQQKKRFGLFGRKS